MTQSARPLRISRNSLASSRRSGACASIDVSGERKKHLFESRGRQIRALTKLLERAGAAHAPGGQQDEAIADALRVSELVDGEDERAAVRGDLAQRAGDRARLAQIEAVERLVHQQQRMRRDERERKQQAAVETLREAMH